MANSQEIWFFKGSPVASLARKVARSIGRQCQVRVADFPEQSANGHHKGTKSSSKRNGKANRSGRADNFTFEHPAVWLADATADLAPDLALELRGLAAKHPQLRLIALVDGVSLRKVGRKAARKAARKAGSAALPGPEWFALLPRNAPDQLIRRAVASAFDSVSLAESERNAREELARAEREQEELNRIGVALSATHDVGELLRVILAKTREITAADAGSLYVVEEERSENGGSANGARRLRFRLTQNDSKSFPFAEFTLPISENSITGYAALHGEVVALDDAYDIPEGRPYRFNPDYDQQTGYRTRSLLTVPMKNPRGEVIGVVQLVNCKRHPAARLVTPADTEREVQPFSPRAIRLAESLASQAAVAYENNRLYEDIESLFEGFVGAAVTAIEQRDPTTSGHSMRVSRMTMGLAEIVDRADSGSYRSLRFTPDQMKEIRYAGLLHDFGKVAVREEILVKAKKLYPGQFDVVQNRFDYVRKEIEARHERRKFHVLLELPRDEALERVAEIDEDFRRQIEELDNAFALIVESNEPTVVASGQFGKLLEVAQRTYFDPRGAEHPWLTPEETRFLSIRKGSLDNQERQQIESHVVHSVNFLMQIPWTRSIRAIPQIVRAHHEKLNGTGYPYRLKGQEIPVQARMMTICDIFDALSAADRPYKKAMPAERALSILEDSVTRQELDPELFKLFLDGRIYELPFHAYSLNPL